MRWRYDNSTITDKLYPTLLYLFIKSFWSYQKMFDLANNSIKDSTDWWKLHMYFFILTTNNKNIEINQLSYIDCKFAAKSTSRLLTSVFLSIQLCLCVYAMVLNVYYLNGTNFLNFKIYCDSLNKNNEKHWWVKNKWNNNKYYIEHDNFK